ncbi:MAG TPA: ABC transporter ATP-binding protein [Burkholderiales bacterium]|nr:ABC transporter ATP-binding protein [Burkholderiales bacterium]
MIVGTEKADPLLQVAEVSHRFGGLHVLRGVDFGVPPGSLTGLIGPNGAGKSTLFNIISGFLPPQRGTVRFAGRDITRDPVQTRTRAGLVRTFQTPKVFGKLSVRENLMIGCYRHLVSGVVGNMLRSRRSRVEMELMHAQAAEAGERFGLTSVMERAAGQVTAGMQRLVELARACVSQPRLLMLDEPSSGLNTTEIAQLRELLQRLNREGITILLVSHDMHLVEVASRVHVLCFGSIIASGAMAQIKQDERVRQAYLGV